jgi:hypothetical protein
MPTGYTADIEKGITFEQFIWSCARQFGALITMRDERSDAPIPEAFQPSTWNKDELAKAETLLAELKALTSDQANGKARVEYDGELAHHEKYIADKRELEKKYRAILAQVRVWHPPTPDHVGLKSFMEQQITESIKFDCGTEYLTKPKLLSGTEWLNTKVQKCLRDIEYHSQEQAKEEERVAGRNTWLRELRKSVVVPANVA